MNTIHSAADVSGAFVGDEMMEKRKSLDFAAGGVEERGAEDVHALDVDGGLAFVSAGVGVIVIIIRCSSSGSERSGEGGIIINNDKFVFVFFGDARWCFD